MSPFAPEIRKMKVNTQTECYFPKIFTLFIYFIDIVFMTFIHILKMFIIKYIYVKRRWMFSRNHLEHPILVIVRAAMREWILPILSKPHKHIHGEQDWQSHTWTEHMHQPSPHNTQLCTLLFFIVLLLTGIHDIICSSSWSVHLILRTRYKMSWVVKG